MADSSTIPDWLGAERNWLAGQRGMTPWPPAAARIRSALSAWIARYSGELGIASSPGLVEVKLWTCWLHHWKTAAEKANEAVDGFDVAAQIEAGRGYRRSGNLGGNAIRDVILADAMLRKVNAALRAFETEYKEPIARQVEAARRFVRNDPAWWNDLLAELVGVHRAGREGRLARYTGQSGMIPWTVTVAIRLLADRAVGVRHHEELDRDLADAKAGAEGALGGVISANCVELLAARIREALARLGTRERLALKLLAVDGLQGQQIAAVFGINPGNASRLLQSARDALWKQLSANESRAAEHRDCFEAVMEGREEKTLADALRAALEEFAREKLP